LSLGLSLDEDRPQSFLHAQRPPSFNPSASLDIDLKNLCPPMTLPFRPFVSTSNSISPRQPAHQGTAYQGVPFLVNDLDLSTLLNGSEAGQNWNPQDYNLADALSGQSRAMVGANEVFYNEPRQ
jgi:hypothetical protein